jgi:hypothetical protein
VPVATATAHDGSVLGHGGDDQFEFEFALDLLLDGFERLYEQGWSSAQAKRIVRQHDTTRATAARPPGSNSLRLVASGYLQPVVDASKSTMALSRLDFIETGAPRVLKSAEVGGDVSRADGGGSNALAGAVHGSKQHGRPVPSQPGGRAETLD